jgi:hypothetical protein
VSSLQTGNQQLHAIDTARRHQQSFSLDAERDQKVIYTLASRFAAANRINNYSGVLLQAGRRTVTPVQGVARYHALVWINPNYITIIEMDGNSRLDWIDQGVCEMSELHLLRAIVFLESRKEALPLTELLARSEPAHEVKEAGRIRGDDWLEDDLQPPPLVDYWDDEDDDPGPSISEVDPDSDEDHEAFLASVRTCRMKERAFPVLNDSAFPVDRKTRPLTPEELQTHAAAVEQACVDELSSWLKNQTCVPRLSSDYSAKT